MSTLTQTSSLTMLELAKRIDPNGDLAVIAEVLTRDNAILADAPMVEANDIFSHRTTRRLNLPTGTWRRLNEGVGIEASQTEEVIEGIAMLETYAQSDKKIVDTAPNPSQMRNQEAAAFIEGLSQTLSSAVIYGNAATDPEKFTGLQPRLATLNTTNVLGCSGTGSDVSSMYIVQWGEDKVHMLYPRGSKTIGIKRTDLGEMRVESASGKYFQAYVDHFEVNTGLAVRDPRCIARVANIETSGSSNLLDEDKIIAILNKMPYEGRGAVIYCNATIFTQLDILSKDKTNVFYGPAEPFGKPVMYFRGAPVRRVDAILNTETAIS